AGDRLFTRLSLLLDKGEEVDQRWEKESTYTSLADILDKNPDEKAFVLLGAPGAGKSTLLRRLDLECADAGLVAGAPPGARLSWFLSLRDYDGHETPLAWLEARWRDVVMKGHAGLFDLQAVLAERPMYLLLDALNEMPSRDAAHFGQLVGAWSDFL